MRVKEIEGKSEKRVKEVIKREKIIKSESYK